MAGIVDGVIVDDIAGYLAGTAGAVATDVEGTTVSEGSTAVADLKDAVITAVLGFESNGAIIGRGLRDDEGDIADVAVADDVEVGVGGKIGIEITDAVEIECRVLAVGDGCL